MVRRVASRALASYFAYQTLAGALLHLVVLDLIVGLLLGIVGGPLLNEVGHP